VFIRFAAVCFLSLLAACSNRREQIRTRLSQANLPELRKDAARLYVHLRPGRAPEFIALKKTQWPESFKKLQPIRVGCYKDGFTLVMEGEAASERGLHIVPIGMTVTPAAESVRYEKLEEGIYWYELGK